LKTDLVPGKAPASPPATSTVVMMTGVSTGFRGVQAAVLSVV
jgi:hypothetical protein